MQLSQYRHRIPAILLTVGLVLILVLLVEGLYVLFVSNPLGVVWVGGAVTSIPFVSGILTAGLWLPYSPISDNRYLRVSAWCVGGLGSFLGINLVIMATMPPEGGFEFASWCRWAATLGAGVGMVIGTFEAQGIERAVEAEREHVRAEEAETRQELLMYLNATLRHEILNTATVIIANSDVVLSEYEDDEMITDYMGTIKSRTRDMEAVIEDVQLLLRAPRDGFQVEPIDVTELLSTEIDRLQETNENVSVDSSLPDQAVVRANRALRRAFANLLWNAVEHNDSDQPVVEVTLRREPDTVVVTIADNGAGISEAEQDVLFDTEIRRDANHGLGIALTATILESYDGTIELTDTGPDGTVFTLTLPRATETDRSSAE